MLNLKSEEQIDKMRVSSLLASDTLAYVATLMKPGVTGLELDAKAAEYIQDHGAKAGFKGYNGFPNSLCISINECVVHGIPSKYEFREGDIISVDCGIYKNGYFGDVAFTFGIAPLRDEVAELLSVTRGCLEIGVSKAIAGNRIGDIGHSIQQHAQKKHGYGVVRELVGHGLGENLHEKPEVPNYGRRSSGPVLKEGLTIAIEPMINLGTKKVRQLKDGWGIITKDRKPSAHYEHDVVVRENEAEVLSDHLRIDEVIKKNDFLQSIPIKN